jgi:hypothetical protein
MSQRLIFFKSMKTFLWVMLFVVGLPAMAAPLMPPTNTVPETVTNTLSVFVMPADPKGGRDPFFPSSLRPYQTTPIPGVKTTELNLDSLVMQGISGMPPHRLVIINKHTFAVGDYGEVSTSQGRLHLHCLEINADSVIIEVNGQRHELRYQEKQ